MKKIIIILFLFASNHVHAKDEIKDPNIIIEQMINECKLKKDFYSAKLVIVNENVDAIRKQLLTENSNTLKLDLLIKKDLLIQQQQKYSSDYDNDITKIRYIKGLQIIKLLYDKVLSLDHHFASVRTFSEISKISNPNSYPEFGKLKDVLNEKKDKKSFNLSSLLGQNIVASVIQTFSGLVNSTLSKDEKEKEIQSIECILDFTLRMHNDLNLIYFETSYLQASNDEIKKDIESMFKEYTKPVGYVASLPDCRSNDDWDNLNDKLSKYLLDMSIGSDKNKMHKMQINLEFSIDRLLQFIAKYNNFIDDGVKFYQKFKTILNSYENEKQCESKLPLEFKKLKTDIDVAIDKFNVAYKPVEINGTKMKEILYGINEYN
jgi:hypothetical protein